MPTTESAWQITPFASVLCYMEDGIENLKVRTPDIAALARQAVLDSFVL
jgi:hypothetical protein